MFKVKLRFFFSLVSLSFFSNVRSQNLIINELSNGPSGSKEYVELLVVGTPTCNGIPTLDLRGYYIDDNNGAHASGSGTGIADGCYRFKFDPFWSNIPIGTLILIYNDLDYNTNIGTVATPLSDLSMSDGNCRLIIPISNTSLIERHTTLPSTASAVYPTSGLTTSGIWGNVGMANTADSFHTVDALGNIIFAISWGNNTLNTNIYVNSTQSGKVFYMDNSVSNSYTNQANWTNANVSTSGSETPGLPNNVANAAWISSMNNSCSAISPFNVSISSTNASCSATGSATVSATGAISPYTYTWFPSGGNGTVATGLAAGLYSVSVSSSNGCLLSQTVSITSSSSTSVTINTPTICSGNSTILTATPSSLGGTYLWSPGGQTTQSISVSPAVSTTYSVDYNLSGCVTNETSLVNVNPNPTISVNNSTVCSGQSATLTASGASSYTFSSGSNVVTPLSNTSYSVIGTSALGCVGSNTAVSTVTVNSTPSISLNSGAICSGNSFTITPSGASSYNYSSGSNVVSPTTITSYTVTGTSALGCTNTAVSTVSVNSIPNISVNSGSICSGNSFTITPSGASTYTYSSGSNLVSPTTITSYTVTGASALGCTNTAVSTVSVDGIPIISVNSGSICSGNSFTLIPSGANTYTYSSGSNVVSPLTNTSYSVTGTSSLGCVGSNTAVSTVSVNGIPIISVNSGSICSGNSFTMIPSGANTYSYSSGSNVVSPTTITSYTVTGTSALGCTNTAISTVSINGIPIISVNSGSICSGNSFTLIPSGANTYTYSSGTSVVSPLINTSFSVTGTSSLGCVGSNTAVSTVTVNGTPSITINSGAICSANSFTLIPSGANTYTYSSGSSVVSPTTITNYTVTGANALGCTNIAVSTVTVNAIPIISVNSGSICSGNSFTITPSGASSYTYSSGINVVSPTTTSNYTVTGTSALGCTNTAISTVLVNGIPIISVNSGSICSGNSFTLIPSGANTYTYSSGTNVVSPLTNTSYSVTGTSALGCIGSNTAVSSVTVNSTPSITINSGVICSGKSFTLIPSGANTYTYSSGSNVVSPLTNTSYSVTGTSALGCVGSNTAVSTLTVNATPSITVNSGVICSGKSFTILPSGANTYTFSSGTNVVSPLTNTSYFVTGTSALGCVGSNTAVCSVTVNSTPIISVNSGVICSGNSFTLIPSGGSFYTYSSGSNVVSPTTTSIFTVTGASALGCTNIALSTVSVNAIPNISVNSGAICIGNSYTITPSGASYYTYSSGSNIVSPTMTTSYTVTGASALGCTNVAVSTVSVNAIPIISVNSGSICSGNSFTITPSGANTYTYSSGSNVVNPTTPVSYTVTGANLLGCTNTAISTVFSVMPLPTPSITANTNTLCLNQKLILQGFGGTSYYWLLPNNSILTSQTMSLIAYNSMYSGTYTLIVSDAYACVNSTTKKIKVENLPGGYLIYNNGLNNCVPFCNNYTFVPSGVTTTLSSIIQQFNWQINNQSVSSQNTFSYCFINAGTYIVKGDLTSDLGCANSVTMQIIGYPKPIADFTYSPKHPIENMEEVSFVSSGKDQNIKNFNWLFMFNKTEYTSNQINPSFLFENAGTYSVALIVTNEYECKDTVIKTIRVASDFAVYVPNSFTPNEDNKNDTFNAVTRGVKIYSLFIFDRWGHQIFETTDLNTGWDGTFKGQLCPSDIYVWKIYATSTEGVFKELTGHLMLYP